MSHFLKPGRLPLLFIGFAFLLAWTCLTSTFVVMATPDIAHGEPQFSVTDALVVILSVVLVAVVAYYSRLQERVNVYVDAENEAILEICAQPSVPNHIYASAEVKLYDAVLRQQRTNQHARMYVSHDTEYLQADEPDYNSQAQDAVDQRHQLDSVGV